MDNYGTPPIMFHLPHARHAELDRWDLVLVFSMWTVMMVAMMVPAASPVVLLFAEINRRRNGQQGAFVSTAHFLLGLAGHQGLEFCSET